MGPLSEPETQAIWRDVLDFEPDLVAVLQSALAGPLGARLRKMVESLERKF